MIKTQPSDLGLDQWRDVQLVAIQNSLSSNKRFIGQCAPTGSGKSALLMGEILESGKRALILTSSKELQNQYLKAFAHLNILDIRGKANYYCRAQEVGGEFYDGTPARTVDQAPCQFGEECGLKAWGCSYYDRVNAAKYRRIVSANYAAWISSNLYTEGWGQFDLVCMDEADAAEDWLARMLAVRLPRAYSKLCGAHFPRSTNVSIWQQWAARELPMIKAAVRLEKKELKSKRRGSIAKLRTLQQLEGMIARLCVMTSEWRIFKEEGHILFQPIWVHEYAESLLFKGASKVVFASATMVRNTLNLLGVLDRDMDFWSYPSSFPVDRRPIYYCPVVRMNYRTTEEEFRECVDVIDSLVSKRLDRKGFIPIPSHALAKRITDSSKFGSLMVASSPSSTQTSGTLSASMSLMRHRISPAPSILIGPSWNVGTDLCGEQAEYTIIPKMFFSDITDPLHIARSEDNPDYGYYDAGVRFTQAVGRAMRSDTDRNQIIVLDYAFGNYLTIHKRMLPDWIHAAIIRSPDKLPEPLEKL